MTSSSSAREGLLTLRARLVSASPSSSLAAGAQAGSAGSAASAAAATSTEADRERSLVAHILQLVSARGAADEPVVDEHELEIVSHSVDGAHTVDASISGRTARVIVERLDALQTALELAGEAVRGVGLPLPEREHTGLTAIERVQVRLRAHLAFAEPRAAAAAAASATSPARDERWLADALDRARVSTLELLAEAGAARLTFTVAGWRRAAIA